jgi:CMP-2-keto-3-deoxyoctulosonic acid synthetase
LRFVELGVDVYMTPLTQSTHAVDVPEDVQKIEEALRK